MTKVTAIVSAYYAADYIDGRLTNLLEQSPRPEIVVIAQQGSIEEQIARQYGCLVLTTAGIPTLYKAWNIGIRACSGEYITSANCDDRLYPDALKTMAKALDKYADCGVAYSDIDIDEEGKPIRTWKRKEPSIKSLLTTCAPGPFPMWRKALHNKYGLFNEAFQVAGDYEFWLRLASRGVKFHHIKKALGTWAKRPDALEFRDSTVTHTETRNIRQAYKPLADRLAK